jgi:large subunit ribosomal protein L17
MRHRVYGKHLKRDKDQRKALRLALATALLKHERIVTTEAKADFVRAHVEKLITLAKRGLAHEDPARGVHARRIAGSRLNNDREIVGKLFDTIAPRYVTRPGGYTRVLKLGPRKGDAAEMVILELVDRPSDEPAEPQRRPGLLRRNRPAADAPQSGT